MNVSDAPGAIAPVLMQPLSETDVEPLRRQFRIDLFAGMAAAVVFAGLSVWAAVKSQGFLEMDAATHFVIARQASEDARQIVGVWGRPLCTGIYALPASLRNLRDAVVAVRCTSLLLALICAATTWCLAKGQRLRWPSLAVICLLAQPLFFLHSFSELTEIPFVTLLTLAFLAYQRRQWLLLSLLTAFLPLGRPEGLAFALFAAFALLAHRRWWWVILLPLPMILWCYIGWVINDRPYDMQWWQWLGRNSPWSWISPYGKGDSMSFVARLPAVTSPGFFPFTIIGIVLALTAWPRGREAVLGFWRVLVGSDHARRCRILAALLALFILVAHSLLWFLGLMASNGELRYMIIVAPFWALLAAEGCQWFFNRYNFGHMLAWASTLALLPILANARYRVVPLSLYDNDLLGQKLAQWYRSDDYVNRRFPHIMATPPMMALFLDLKKADQPWRMVHAGKTHMMDCQPGTVLIWDKLYGQSNSDQGMVVHEQDIEKNGWIPYRSVMAGEVQAKIYLSRQEIDGNPTMAPTVQ